MMKDSSSSSGPSASSSSSSLSSNDNIKKERRENSDDKQEQLLDSLPTSREPANMKKARIFITNQIANDRYFYAVTLSIMYDPVIAADGNTYERLAILEHLKIKNISPCDYITKISADNLLENRVFKNMIVDFVV